MADDEPDVDWWDRTFGPAQASEDLEQRVRRLEIQLKQEQDRSGKERKRLSEAHSRIERAKDAIEFGLVLALIPGNASLALYLWQRYDGWELAAAWLSFGMLATFLIKDAFYKINRI